MKTEGMLILSLSSLSLKGPSLPLFFLCYSTPFKQISEEMEFLFFVVNCDEKRYYLFINISIIQIREERKKRGICGILPNSMQYFQSISDYSIC